MAGGTLLHIFLRPGITSRYRIALIAALVAVSLWVLGCAGGPPSGRKYASESDFVVSTLKRLTLSQKVSQMVMSRAYGYYYSSGSDEYRRLERLVRQRQVGGLCFFQGDVYETALLVNRLQGLSDVPLLIASDFEWGSAMRIRRGTRFPEAMAVGATRDTAMARAIGKAVAQEARAMGVGLDFAPVADVNVNPDNPVINTRSFGEDPALVASMAGAFASGLQSGGVLATGKHFPGHGDTQVDSHLDLPIISAPRSRLDSVELTPFRELIRRGVSSMMIAHLEVPAIEGQHALPATLSGSIVQGLLEKQLGFGGLVITDAMDMGALIHGFGVDSSAIRAVDAGADILLIPLDEDRTVEAIVAAVKSGRLSEARIDMSVQKILAAKWSVGVSDNRLVDPERIQEAVATPEHLLLAKEVARKSITVLKNDSILPFPRFNHKKILNVVITDAEQSRTEINRTSNQWPNEPTGDYFNAQLRKRYGNLSTYRIDPSANRLDFDSVRYLAKRADLILCSIFSKAHSGSGQFGLPKEIVACVQSLFALNHPVVLIAIGSPYVLSAFPDPSASICSYSDAEISSEATAEILFGEVPSRGKLPVTVPGKFAYGSGLELNQDVLRYDVPESAGFRSDSLARLDAIMQKAISDSAFPGGELLISKDGAVVYSKQFGSLEYNAASPRVNNATMYDLASVTKVVATTSALMRLYEEGKFALDDSVVKTIPEFGNHGKEKITIRNLLLHNAGLPPFKRLYMTCTSPQQALDSVYQTEMIYRTGDSTIYSDFDFILLGKIVERVSGAALNDYVDSVFFEPLGMTRTMFRPPESLFGNIAPTEFDSVYRKQLVRGVVHDENAYLLGGVSGHAGLFSNAQDLAVFMQMLMNGGSYGGRRYLKPETISLFTTKQDQKSTRALGWDTKTVKGYSTAGSLFSERSFGHTGFTGTSIWADPDRRIVSILLTNRVYPTRANNKLVQVRPKVHDAIIRALR